MDQNMTEETNEQKDDSLRQGNEWEENHPWLNVRENPDDVVDQDSLDETTRFSLDEIRIE